MFSKELKKRKDRLCYGLKIELQRQCKLFLDAFTYSEVTTSFTLCVGEYSLEIGKSIIPRIGQFLAVDSLLHKHASFVHFISAGAEALQERALVEHDKAKLKLIETFFNFENAKEDDWTNLFLDLGKLGKLTIFYEVEDEPIERYKKPESKRGPKTQAAL